MAAATPPPTASALPTSVSGSRTGDGSCTTGSTTVTASGGTPPYTYAWSSTLGTPTSPASATTSFTATLSGVNTWSGVATCTVTDAAGQSTKIAVAVQMTRNPVPPTYTISPNPNTQSRADAGTVLMSFWSA